MPDWLENGYHDDKSIAWQNHFDENRRWIKHMILQNRRYKTHNLICLKAQCMRAAAFDFTFIYIFAYKSSGQSHAQCTYTFWALKIYIYFVGLCFFLLFLLLICNIAFCEDGTKDINTGGSVFAFGFDYICGLMIVSVRSSKIATFCCILSSLLCFDNWIQYINSADKYKIENAKASEKSATKHK